VKNGVEGMYKLSDLSIGDKIKVMSNYWPCVDKDLPIDQLLINTCNSRKNYESDYIIPINWSDDLASILGYLIAEGQNNREYGVRFTNGNADTLSHFSNLCYSVFKHRPVDYSDDGLTVDLNGIGIRELLLGLGLERKNAHTKRIPHSLWHVNKSHVASFLRSYFEGDGTAAIEKGSRKPAVACYTVSENLANDVLQLLWALGIKASLSRTRSRKFSSKEKFDHDCYSVRIYGNNIIKYSNLIGFWSERKKLSLLKCVERVLEYDDGIDDDYQYLSIKDIGVGSEQDLYDIHVPGTHTFLANSVMNHNSGKTATAGIMGTYVEHRVIALGHSCQGGLAKYFNQLPKQPFEIAFIASTDVQSADTIWARFTASRQQSPWLSKYIKWIKQKEVEQTTPNGVKPWTYEEREKYIVHGALNLKMNSLNSNSGGLAGRTRMAAFIDELARFENTDSARSADEAYRVLENSLRTLRSAATKKKDIPWLGTMVSISSPISDDDKSMRLLKQAPNIRGMYYGHYATWEFNPDQPREMFDDDFEKDPIGAMRDFGASPPTVASPLIADPNKFRELAIQQDLQPTATFKKLIYQDKSGREYVSAAVESAQLMRNGERYICIDAGASFDQFAAACAHGEWVITPEGKQLVTVFDWAYRLVPESKPRRDIWFDFIVQMIDNLSKYYYIGRVEIDRWQSTYLIQSLRNRGIMCEMKGTTVDHFNKLINDVNYSKVRMLPPMPDDSKVEPPFMSAAGLAFYELERLERTPDLKKVYNSKKGKSRGYNSDDIATVVAHVSAMVQGAVIDIDGSNGISSRLRREQSGGHQSVGGTIFRPPTNKRLW
jgi:hypothetical protein